jgi:hypothetical protein
MCIACHSGDVSEPIRVREDDYERIAAAQAVLGLSFPETVHLALHTDLLDESPAQNARRAIQNYYTYILLQYDDPHEVPVDDLEFDGVDQAKSALTIGAQKRAMRQSDAE